jgi:hypothetical protein
MYYGGQKILDVNFSLQKKNYKPYFLVTMIIDYHLDYDWYILGGKFQNSKLLCQFLRHRRLPQVI